MANAEPQRLICVNDRTELNRDSDNTLTCPSCNRRYFVEKGVIRFLAEEDQFYEGAYLNHVKFIPKSETLFHTWPLWLICNGYPWIVRKYVPARADVVELGCAGGHQYFGNRYNMIGVDLSFSSLAQTEANYQLKIQTDAGACIPLKNSSVDAIISSYFWEHIPPEVKPKILAECYRILRPSGKIIFLYDVETSNPMFRKLKEGSGTEYKELFIDGDGHLGYQAPQMNLSTIEQAGFLVLRHIGMEKTFIQSPSVYDKLAKCSKTKSWFMRMAAKLGSAPWVYPYTFFVRAVDTLICPFLPMDRARIDLVVAEKSR